MGVKRGSFEQIRLENPAKAPIALTAHVNNVDVSSAAKWRAGAVKAENEADLILFNAGAKTIAGLLKIGASIAGAADGLAAEQNAAGKEIADYKAECNNPKSGIKFDSKRFADLNTNYENAKANNTFGQAFMRGVFGNNKLGNSTATNNPTTQEDIDNARMNFDNWGSDLATESLEGAAAMADANPFGC